MLTAASFAPTAAVAASAESSGTSGTCEWFLDEDGILTFSPSDGVSSTLANLNSDDGAPWLSLSSQILAVVFEEGVCAGQSASRMFYYCESLASAEGAANLDVSSVEDMSGMFFDCSLLASLDLMDWSTAAVTQIDAMLALCTGPRRVTSGGMPPSGVVAAVAVGGWRQFEHKAARDVEVPGRG